MKQSILYIGSDADGISGVTAAKPLSQTPSLMPLAFLSPRPSAVVLDIRRKNPYSLPHLLQAAAQLRSWGIPFAVLSPPNLLDELQKRRVYAAASVEEVNALLSQFRAEDAPPPLPAGATLRVHVCGAQKRIGCTTQAFALCRRIRSMGYPAALIADSVKNAAVLSLAEDGAVRGIPLISAPEARFPISVYDLGIDSPPICGNINVLVCGVKPWELVAAIPALTRLRTAPHPCVIVSFAEAGQSAILRQLCPEAEFIEAPSQPDPFAEITDFSAYRSFSKIFMEAMENVTT